MSNSRKKRQFTQEFRTESARLVVNQGYTCTGAAEAVGINVSLMAKCVKVYKDASGDVATAFPGKGHLSPHDAELAEMRKQLKKVTNERDILKKGNGILCGSSRVNYAFIERLMAEYSVTELCAILRVSRTGFYKMIYYRV